MTSQLPAEELLPCPFCGSAAAFGKVEKASWDSEPHSDEGGEYIACTDTACATSSMLIFPTMADAKPLLIEKWNRRVAK